MLPGNMNNSSKTKALSSSLLIQADNVEMREGQQQQQLSKQPNNQPRTLATNGYDARCGSGNMVYGSSEPRLFDNLLNRVAATATFGNYSNQTSPNTQAVAQRQLRQYRPYSSEASSSAGWTNRLRKGNYIYTYSYFLLCPDTCQCCVVMIAALDKRVFYFSRHTDSEEVFCLVCSQSTFGLKYGIVSCEACKQFFVRSISKKRVYKCKKQQCCDMTLDMRKDCKYCRIKKCLDQGMNRNGNYTMPSLMSLPPLRLQDDAVQINIVTVSRFFCNQRNSVTSKH